jgi:putative ABC transport system permease protein
MNRTNEQYKTEATAPAPRRSVGQVWGENFNQAISVILTHKMRSGLLILGVAIGVTAVLSIVTIMAGLSRRIRDDFLSANRPYIVVSRFDPMEDTEDERDLLRRKKFTDLDVRALEEHAETVDRIDFEIEYRSGPLILRRKGERTNFVSLVAATPNLLYILSLNVEEGRFFTDFEMERKNRVVVLGYGPAKDLFPDEDPIGKRIRIGNHEYEVVGTLESRRHIIGSIGDNFAVIPYTTHEKDLMSKWDDAQIVVTVKPEYTLEEGMEEIVAIMRARRGLEPGEENDFAVTTSEAFADVLGKITTGIALVLIVISSIGLMVGGIGVMNIMLVSVTERTREVGVRMALGARRTDILTQFLIEASTLTGIGGLVGIAMGLLVARGVSNLIRFPFAVPTIWVVIAFAFSASIGLIFGLYPANRAAKMDPIKALHYE